MSQSLAILSVVTAVLGQPAAAEREGDPLPEGAIVRLGSVRFLHGDWVHTIAFFPDSKVLLGGSHGPALRLWDIGGDELGRLAGDGSSIGLAALSPNGKVVAAGDNGGNLFLWDAASAKVLHKIPARVSTVSWSGDGKILAAAGGGGAILLIDPAKGDVIGRLEGHKDFVQRIVFAEKGSLLVSATRAGDDRSFRVWDVAQKKQLHQPEGLVDFYCLVAISPDGKFVAGECATPIGPKSTRSSVRVWDLDSGKMVHDLPAYSVSSLTFSRDSKFLLTGHGGGQIRFWEIATGKETRQWKSHTERVTALAFTKDGKTLASGGADRRIRLWDAASGKEHWPREGHSGPVQALAFAPDGRTLVSGGLDCTIRFWDWSKGRELGRCEDIGEYWGVEALAFATDGKSLVSMDKSTMTASFRVWDPVTRQEKSRFGEKALHVSHFVLMPDRETLAGACWNGAVGFWELTSGKLIRSIGKHKDRLVSLAVAPDGKTIAWAGGYQGMGLWDAATGKDIVRLLGSHHHVDSALAYSPDGTLLATASNSGDPIRLWDVPAGKVAMEWKQLRATALAFSPQGLMLATASGKEVILLDVATRKELRRFRGHMAEIKAIVWIPNSAVLASASADGTVLIWDVSGLTKDGRLRPLPLEEKSLEELWQALGDDDPIPAHQALWKLAACRDAPAFLAKRLPPAAKADERLRNLRALGALEASATPAARKLLETLAATPDTPLSHPARAALKRIER
jgi:WD40 repeat protein